MTQNRNRKKCIDARYRNRPCDDSGGRNASCLHPVTAAKRGHAAGEDGDLLSDLGRMN